MHYVRIISPKDRPNLVCVSLVKVIFSGMSMKSGPKTLEISPSDFALAFDTKPTQIFNQIFDDSVDGISKKISYGEYFRFWSNFNGNPIPALTSKEKQYSIKYENIDGSSQGFTNYTCDLKRSKIFDS